MSAKRILDITISAIGLAIVSPIMIVITLIIRLESKGPVFYACKRVGLDGRPFRMLKFRTMVENADSYDCKLCGEADVRVTSFGRLLRRSKLNELPQLINVLKGEMSLVGPRPEDPKFIDSFTDKWKTVLTCKPGLFGPNQIIHRNEEDLYEKSCEPEKFYVEELLPKKLEVDIHYAQNNTFLGDIILLFKGVWITLFGSGRFSRLFTNWRLLIRIAGDLSLSFLAYFFAYFLRYETIILDLFAWKNIGILLAINVFLFPVSGIYRTPLRFFALSDLLPIAKWVIYSALLLVVGSKLILAPNLHSRAIFLMYPIILFLFMVGIRVIKRFLLEHAELQVDEESPAKNALIYGAGRLGVETAERLRFENGFCIVGFVDDDQSLRNLTILGHRILGTGIDLPALKSLYAVETVFIALTNPNSEMLRQIQQNCIKAGLTQIVITNSVPKSTSAHTIVSHCFRRTRASDLLGMKEAVIQYEKVEPLTEGATIAVTNAGNIMGENLCREVLKFKIRKLILIESSPERLNHICKLTDSLKEHKTAVVGLLIPSGYPDLLKSTLEKQTIDYILLNMPNKCVYDPSMNRSALFIYLFIETIRSLDIIQRLKCNGLTIVSPFLKSAISEQEKSLHLYIEHYAKHHEMFNPHDLNFGIFRLPNILEADCAAYDANGNGNHCGPATARFTSARYAARLVLNVLPIQNNGQIFVETVSRQYKPQSLAEMYSEILTKGTIPSLPWNSEAVESECNEDSWSYAGTMIPDLKVMVDHEIPDVQSLKLLWNLNKSYLTNSDKLLLKKFTSILEDEYAIDLKPKSSKRFAISAA